MIKRSNNITNDFNTNFNVNLTQDFKEYLDSLNIAKKSNIISRLLFLESTGFLGNCKALGNNIFEYKIDAIKDNIKCFMNNDNILFFVKQNNDNDLMSLKQYNNEALKNLKFTKTLYNEVYSLYKQTDEEIFFINILKNILVVQGKENFKKITNFDSVYIENNGNKNELETLGQLKNNIKFIIQLKSIDYISEKAKINKENIEQILKVKEDINLIDLQKLIKFLNKN